MTPDRWQRVKELFDQAAAVDPSDRAAFLDLVCEDSELKAEVASLLASDDQDVTLLERPVGEILGEILPAGPATGRRFGPYRTVREIGRGGMAVVYAAVRDDDQYRKQVAIKLIKRGMDTDAIVARFLKERQILANLEHPNIARMLDGGMSEDGLPYLVMEYVEGVPIDRYCDQQVLSTEARLELFRAVCAAVQFAHQNLIVHRDLKPTNILVDTTGAPKLLDFGIAKLLAADRTLSTLVTVDGIRPMTPEYASPEQIRSQPITTASDTYALGALLYLLLTGHRPYRLHRRTQAEIELVVCEREPQKPSTVLERDTTLERATTRSEENESPETLAEAVSRSRGTSPQGLRRKLSGDLDNIVLMALQKAPEKRYGSVEQFSEDIRRYLEGMPVIARPDVLAYRASKFVRRHRWGVTAVLLIVLSLVTGIVATAWQARVAHSERVTAEEVSNFLVSLFENSRPDKALGETVTARELLDQGAQRIGRELDDPKILAKLLDSIGLAYYKLGLYPEAAPRLEEALDLRLQTVGEGHLEVAASKSNLGELRVEQGLFRDAEKLHREALQIRQLRLGEEHELVADSLINLAVALYQQGRHDVAEPLLHRALEVCRQVFGEEHTKVAYVLNNLALVVYRKNRYEEAEKLSRQALAMNRRLLDEDHPGLAVNLNNLAEVLRAQGECEEAISLYEQVIELRIRVLGDRHPGLATSWNNLAGCLTDLRRYEEAERFYRSSLKLRRETLDDKHPAIAGSLNNLARIYFLRGQLDSAEEFYRQALKLHRDIHGDNHTAVATNLGNLATVREKRGDPEAAEQMYREALAINLGLLDDEDPAVLEQRHKLAYLLLNVGQLDEAESEFRAELAARRRSPESTGSTSRDVAHALFGLARVLMAADRPDRAEPLFSESLEIFRRWPAEEWFMINGTESMLGNCLTALGRYQEAEPLLLGSYSRFKDRRGADHPSSRRALGRLLALYEAWGRPESAAHYREQARE